MNIKKKLSNFESLIFAGLTFLGFIFVFLGVIKSESFNDNGEISLISVTGIILMLGFPFYLIKTKILLKKNTKKEADRIRTLIRTGEKVLVNISNFEIRLDNFNQNSVIINIPYKNELIEYRLQTSLEIEKLKELFLIEEETAFYINSINPNDNYLNLNFLNRLLNVEHLNKLSSKLLKFRNKINNELAKAITKKEKENFLIMSNTLNHLLYELDVNIESEIFDDELVKKCEEILQLNEVDKKTCYNNVYK